MFSHLIWAGVERAASKLGNKKTPLLLLIKQADNTVVKRKISADQFKKQLWELYDSKKRLLEVAVVNPKGNDVIYHHSSKTESPLEEIPIGGDSWIITEWKTFTQSRKDALLKLLMAQIMGNHD